MGCQSEQESAIHCTYALSQQLTKLPRPLS